MSIRKALEKVQNFSKAKVDFNEKSFDQLSVDEVHELIKLAENLERYTKNKKQLVELDSKVTKMEEVLQKLDNITFSEIDNLKRLIKNSKSAENLTENLREELTEAIGQVSTRMSTLVGASGSGEVWLKNLDDVDRSSVSSASNGQALVYDSSMGKWKAGAATGGASDPPENLASVSQDIIPDTDETRDLGSSTKKWKDLYLSGSTLRLGDVEFKSTAEGDVEIKRAVTSAHGTAGDKVKLKIKELDLGDANNTVTLDSSTGTGGGGTGTGGGDMLTVVGSGVRFSETAKHQEKLTKGGSTPSAHMWEGPISGGITSVDTWHFTNRTIDFDYANVYMPNLAEGSSWYPATGCHVVSGQWDTSGSNITLAPGQAFGSVFADTYLASNGFTNWGYNGTQTHQSYNPNNVMHFHMKGRLWDNPVLSPNPQNRGDAPYTNNYPTGWAWPTGANQDINADGTTAVTMYGGKFGITGGSTLYADDEAGNDITKGWFEIMEENLSGGRYGDGSTQFYLSQRNNSNGEWYHYNNYYGLGMQIQIRFPDIENDYTIETDTVNNQGTYRVWGGTQFVEWDATVIGVRDATDPYYGGPMTDIYFVCPDETNYLKAYHAINIDSHRNYDLGNLSNWGGQIYQWYTYAAPENSISNVPLGSNKKSTFRYYVNVNAQVSAKLNWSSYFDSGTRGKTAIEFAPDAHSSTGNSNSRPLTASGIEMGSQAHHDIDQNQDFTYEMNFMLGGYDSTSSSNFHGYDESGSQSLSNTSRYLTTPSEIFSGDGGYDGNAATSLTLFEHGDSTQSAAGLSSSDPNYNASFGIRLYHEANNGTKTFKLALGSNDQITTIKSWDDDPFTVFQNNESSPGAGDGYYNGLFPNRWYHIAVVRSNNKIFIYLDGEDITNVSGGIPWTSSFSFSDNPVPKLMIGNIVNPTISDGWRGSIDNFRISDMARYTSSGFTPPSGDFTGDENTVLIIDKGDHGDTLFRDISYDRSFKHSITGGVAYTPIMSNAFSSTTPDTLSIEGVPKKGSVDGTNLDDFSNWFEGHNNDGTANPTLGGMAYMYDFRTGPGTTANTSGGISSDTEIYQIEFLVDLTAGTATGTDYYGVTNTNNALNAIKADTKFEHFVDRLDTLDAFQSTHGANLNGSPHAVYDFYCAPPASYDPSIHWPGTVSGPDRSITPSYGPNVEDLVEMTIYRTVVPSGETLPALTPIKVKVIAFADRDGTGGPPNDRRLFMYCFGVSSDDVTNLEKIRSDAGTSGMGRDNFVVSTNGVAVIENQVLQYKNGAWSNHTLFIPSAIGDLSSMNTDYIPTETGFTSSVHHRRLLGWYSDGTNGHFRAHNLQDWGIQIDHLSNVNSSSSSNAASATEHMFLVWHQGNNTWEPHSVDTMVGASSTYHALRTVDFSSTLAVNIPMNEPGAILTKEYFEYTALEQDANTVFLLNGVYDTTYDHTNQMRQQAGFGGFKDISTHGGASAPVPPTPDVQSYTIAGTGNGQFSYEGNNQNAPDGYIKMMFNNQGNDKNWWDAHFAKYDGLSFPPPTDGHIVKLYTGTAAGQADDGHNINGLEFIGDYSFDTLFGNPIFYLHPQSGEQINGTTSGDGYTVWDWATNATITDGVVLQIDIAGNATSASPERVIMPIYGSIDQSTSDTGNLRNSPVWVVVQDDGVGARQYSNTTTNLYSIGYADDSFTTTNGPYYGSESILIGGQDYQSGGMLEVFAKTEQKGTFTNPDTGSSTPHHGDFDIPSYYDFCIDGWFKIHSQKNQSASWYPTQLFAFGTETLAGWNNNTHGYGFCAGFEDQVLRIHWNEKTHIYEDGSYWPSGSSSAWDRTMTETLTGLQNSVWYHFACMRTENHFLVFINGNLVMWQNRNNDQYLFYNMLPSQNHTANNNVSSYPAIGIQSPNYPHYGAMNAGGWADNHTGLYLGSGSRVGNYNSTSTGEEAFECIHGYLDSWRFRKALSGNTQSSATAGFGTHDAGGNIYQHGLNGGCAPDWLAEAWSRGITRQGYSGTWTLAETLNATYTNFERDTNVGSPSGNAKWFTPPARKIDNFKSLSPASNPMGSIVAYNPSLNNNINVEYKPFGPPHMTTAERDAAFTTTAQIGAQVYNTDTNKMQGLISDGSSGISWVDLH